MQYVVFGANGYIGSYLFQHLKKDGYDVIGTSRKTQMEDDMVYFDIQENNIDHVLSKVHDEVRIALICIAEPNIDRCFENYDQAYAVNVVQTKQLVRRLADNRFKIIYFSTDNVFDGKTGGYTEASQTHPINKYGMMKAEMEQYMQLYGNAACILRIPKVVSTDRIKQNIFTEWEERSKTASVRCIKGNIISFVCVDDIYRACLIVAEKGLNGLYNIVGDRAYSRAELAEVFFDKLGDRQVEIQECELSQFLFKDCRPLNISMSNLKFTEETKYQFMSMESVIEQYITHVK